MAPGRGDGPGLVGPDGPVTPGLRTGGQLAQRPGRRTRRLAAARGTRHVLEIHAAAVLAPSAAHSSPASKAAVASVTKDSKRENKRSSSTMEAPSP